MLNLTEDPRVGALFLVPEVNETLRVNGRVRISLEPDLLAGMVVNAKLPNAATLIDVEEVYFQCAKAILRSDLWNPDKRVARGTFPSLGRVLADQIKGAEADRCIEPHSPIGRVSEPDPGYEKLARRSH